jgi:hypothetical protein
MSKKLQEVIERVRGWSEDRQEEAAEVLLELETQADGAYQLTPEQIAEVDRRLADPSPRFMTLPELRARLARLGA